MTINKLVLYFVCACSFFKAEAQTKSLSMLELDLLSSFKNIANWRFSQKENRYDSVMHANDVFTEKFKNAIRTNPTTLVYPFKKLAAEGLTVASSPDGNVRIYSWDTWTGGTMHEFDNLFQYRSNSRVLTFYDLNRDGTETSCWYDSIFQLSLGSRKIYLATSYFIGSTIALGGSIRLFEIKNNSLIPAKIIKTKSGMQSSITIGYDATNIIQNNQPYPKFRYDPKSKTMLVPLIDSNDAPTGKLIKYGFDGSQFNRIK